MYTAYRKLQFCDATQSRNFSPIYLRVPQILHIPANSAKNLTQILQNFPQNFHQVFSHSDMHL